MRRYFNHFKRTLLLQNSPANRIASWTVGIAMALLWIYNSEKQNPRPNGIFFRDPKAPILTQQDIDDWNKHRGFSIAIELEETSFTAKCDVAPSLHAEKSRDCQTGLNLKLKCGLNIPQKRPYHMAMGQLIEDANILYKKRKTLFTDINSQLDSLIVLLEDVGKRLGGKVVEPCMVNGDSTLPKVSSISLEPQDSSDGFTESISDELTVQELETVREMASVVKTLECHKKINKALREFNADLMSYDSELNLVSNAEYYNLIITNKTDEKLVCNMIGMHLLHYGLFDIYDQLRLEVIDLWGKNTKALVQSDIVVAYKRLHGFLDDISVCKCDEAIEWIKTVENASVVTKERFELVLLDLFKIHFLGHLYTRDKSGEFKHCECELDDQKIMQLQSFDIGTLWHKHGAQVGKLISQVLLQHNLPTPSEFESLVNSALKNFRRVFCEHGVLIRKARYHKLQVDVDQEDAAAANINVHEPDSQSASPCSTALAGLTVSRQVTMGIGSTITAETIVHVADVVGSALLPVTPSAISRTHIETPTSQVMLEDVSTPKTCFTMDQDSISCADGTVHSQQRRLAQDEDEEDLEPTCIHYPEAMYSWLEFLEEHVDLVKSDLKSEARQMVTTKYEHDLCCDWLSQDQLDSPLGYYKHNVNVGYKSLEPSSLAMGSLAADVKLVVCNGDCTSGKLWYCRNVLACMLADAEAMCRLILPKGYNLENLPAVVMGDACFNQAPVPRESGNRDGITGASGATFRERQYHYRRFIRHGTTVFITTSDDLDDESFLHVSNMSRLLENYPFVRAVDDASVGAGVLTGAGGAGSQALATTTVTGGGVSTGSGLLTGAGGAAGAGGQPPTFSLTLLTGSGSGNMGAGQSATSGRPLGVFSEDARILANPSASRIRINFPNRSIEGGSNLATSAGTATATGMAALHLGASLEAESRAHSSVAGALGSRGVASPRSTTCLLPRVSRRAGADMPHNILRPIIPGGGDTPSAGAGLTPSSSAAASEVAAPISSIGTGGGGGAMPSSTSSLNLRELLRLIVRGVRGESVQSPSATTRVGASRRSPKAETAATTSVDARSVIESPRSKLCAFAPSPLKFSESKYTNPDYVRVFLPCESPVNVVATAGLVTFPNLLSLLSVVCKDQCEASAKVETWIKTNQLPIESNLGPAFHFHSHFVCAVSKDETCAENLPMMLPCGHVICSVCIDRLAGKRRRRQFKCPLCPNVIEGSQTGIAMLKPRESSLEARYGRKSLNALRPAKSDKFAHISSFTLSLHDAFVSCAVCVDFGLDSAKLAQTLDVELLAVFGNLFQCCICYEDALVCAIGTCNHFTCIKCALKFATIYSRNRSYTCPYCSSVHALVFIGPNLFFVALALYRRVFERCSYLNGSYNVNFDDLVGILKILNWAPKRQAGGLEMQWRGRSSVTTADLFNVYLARVKEVLERVYDSFPSEVLSVMAKNGGGEDAKVASTTDWAREIYTGGRGTLHANGLRLVPQHRLVFADESCFWLYKRLTSFVCWMPPCMDNSKLVNVATSGGGGGAGATTSGGTTGTSGAGTSVASREGGAASNGKREATTATTSGATATSGGTREGASREGGAASNGKREATTTTTSGGTTATARAAAGDGRHCNVFSSLGKLNQHLRHSHSLVLCNICFDYFVDKRFIAEMLVYGLDEIKRHSRLGDDLFQAHVSCPVCGVWLFDRACLASHAKECHLQCEACDWADGENIEIFADYNQLREHHHLYHYPCMESECPLVVYTEYIQLKLHYASQHPRLKVPAAGNRRVKRQESLQPRRRAVVAGGGSASGGGRGSGGGSGGFVVADFDEGSSGFDGTFNILVGAASVVCTGADATVADADTATATATTTVVEALGDLRTSATFKIPEHMLQLPRNSTTLQEDLPLLGSATTLDNSLDERKCIEHMPSSVLEEALKLVNAQGVCTFKSLVQDAAKGNASQDPSAFVDCVADWIFKILCLCYNVSAPDGRDHNVDVAAGAGTSVKVSSNGMAFLYQVQHIVSKLTNVLLAKAALTRALDNAKQQLAQAALTSARADCEVPETKSKKRGKAKLADKLPLDALDRCSLSREKQTLQPSASASASASVSASAAATTSVTSAEAKTASATATTAPAAKSKALPASSKAQGARNSKTNTSRRLVHLPLEPGSQYVDAKETEIEPPSTISDPLELLIDRMQRGNFYGALADAVYKSLMDNKVKNGAKVCQYTLRCTTRAKLEYMAMEKSQRLGNLSELLSATLLERLEALEPEFHRLAKKAKESNFQVDVLDHWNRRCNETLKRCKVEHLEIIDYWLRASIGAMALANATEFPSLTGELTNAPLGPRRLNYARALNIGAKTQVGAQFKQEEFPSLG